MLSLITECYSPAEWDSLVLSYPNGSFFHSSAWLKVLSQSYGYAPYAVTAGNGTNRRIAVVAEVRSLFTGVRGVALPFSDVAPVLSRKEGELEEITTELSAFAKRRKWRYVELRTGVPIGGWSVLKFFEHTLDLRRSADALYRALRPSTRRNIKKAYAENVSATRTTQFEDVRAYYRLHVVTRRQHGLPPQPFSFFRNLHSSVIEKGKGFVVLARHHGRVIAGGVFLHFGREALFKFGASMPEYQHLRANNLVMWKAILWYAANGYSSFSFGRTKPENHGLLQYKDGWGAMRRTLYYSRWPNVEGQSALRSCLGAKVSAFARRLPLFILRLGGRVVYRHIG
jgi:Acetyltransferase (GNAT) domain